MSRKWSPAAEVARDKLFDQLQFGPGRRHAARQHPRAPLVEHR
jgi:hypothetical protein